MRGGGFTVDLFADGSQLIDLIRNRLYDYDLLFLDIEMPKVNGLQAARAIREHRLPTEIIFVTAHEEYVFEGYVYRAFSYLVKPVSATKLSQELDRYLVEREFDHKTYLLLQGNGLMQCFDMRQIEYIESVKRKVYVVTDRGRFGFYAKLDDLEKRTSPRLLRVHQSFIVNLRKVVEVGRNSLELQSEMQIPVSKRYRSNLIKQYTRLWEGNWADGLS